MRVLIDHDELVKVIKDIDEDNDYLNDQLNALINQLEELKLVWQGDDATEFCGNAEAYVDYIKTVPLITSKLSMIMTKANKYHYKTDKRYAEKMKRAVEPYE